MAYQGQWGTFVHVPKCGGWGFRQFLTDHLGKGNEVGPYHGLPPEIDNGFALIRHPVLWLRSFWAYRNNSDWRVNPMAVPYWPVIVGLTQWAAGLSWTDFVDELVVNQIDYVQIVYSMYRHPHVQVYKLENIGELLHDLGIDAKPPIVHETPNKPDLTLQVIEKLEYVCHKSIKEYGYNELL